MRRLQSIISLLENTSAMKEVTQTQSLITKTGLTDHSSILAKLIFFTALSPSGDLQHAHSIFSQTPSKAPFLYNTMIRAYAQSVSPLKAIHLYNQMLHSYVDTDGFTYTFVLKACARLSSQIRQGGGGEGVCVGRKGCEIHCRVLKIGVCSDCFLDNSLIYMYGQCGFIGFSRKVFDEMSDRNVASWNTMIGVYDGVRDFESANSLFRLSPEKNVVSWNTLIARYVKMGDVDEAARVFMEMPERDVFSWNSMISGYVQVKDYKRALEFFREMGISGVAVSEVTYTSVLGVCAEIGELIVGMEIHESLKQKGFKIEGYLGNALVDMYAKCGSLNLAHEVFDGMRIRHVSCWNSMIMGLAVHGHSKEALELFSCMEEKHEEAVPNRITFIGVLIACSHKGLVQEGKCYFCLMVDKYCIWPDVKHYGCMVDLYSRWGMLNEAYNIIKTMPFDGNSVLWRTILGACRIYGNVEMAEEVFQKIAEVEPPKDGDCILLSNIYADLERWEDVERVRNIMIDLGVFKRPGSSQLGVK